jgi:hypothetical protein
MPTLGNLLAAVRHRLRGMDALSDQVAELTADITDTDLTLMLDAPASGAGIYEIGFEQMRARAIGSDGSVNLYTFGRGYNGTVAAAHTAGSEVTFNPLFPASTIAAEINGVLSEIYPTLYSVKSIDAIWAPGFTLPEDCVRVIAIYRADDSEEGWRPVDTWRFEPDVDKGLLLPYVPFDTTVRISYATRPGQFVLDDVAAVDADFADTTGLDSRVADLVALGVAYRLAPYIDLARSTAAGAEARADAQAKPIGQASTVARLLASEFAARLEQERMVLNREHTDRTHKER